ncbi:MAG TPA: hypothetical protein VGH74_03955 [Planctomycetaceae bacterium]|jgi:hypothetical protein
MTFIDSRANRDNEPTAAEFAYGDGDSSEACLATLPSVKLFLGAPLDSGWIKRKVRTEFDGDVMQNLKKAVYAIGQGGRRWFSGGGELSQRQASVILDYAVLIELLLECRADLARFREDLADCREQLQMQISRYTEGQPGPVIELIDVLAARIKG